MTEDKTDWQNIAEVIMDVLIKKSRKSGKGVQLYIPDRVFKDDRFPFKDGDIVKIEIDPQKHRVVQSKPTESELKGFIRTYLDENLSGVTANAVDTSGAQFFRELNIPMPQWWASFVEYVDRYIPEKIAEGIRLAKKKEEKEEKAWTRRLQRLVKWLVGFIAITVAGILIGWYMALHGFKVP